MAEKTPMDVLHKVMNSMDLSGFERKRTSVFEEDCLAKIEYEKRAQKRKFWRAKPENLVLELRVAANDKKPGMFTIISKLDEA